MLIGQLVRFPTIKQIINALKGELLDATAYERLVYTKFLRAMGDPEELLFNSKQLSQLFGWFFSTEKDLLLERPPATNVVAASKPHEEVINGRKGGNAEKKSLPKKRLLNETVSGYQLTLTRKTSAWLVNVWNAWANESNSQPSNAQGPIKYHTILMTFLT